ncbi:MAG: UDP-3-O-[3-hydroxymyristoyl] N-acetylglucosamine deacetylase [Ignavibacteriales bacterium CG18_big_fil_WC_8_21_14_2_50_31_20]|nr:MAG: UDP-3-O-[3-hydroxymyristoyl] N-acetylglucosamine deacetylase [Ignavibacteriales bacterium CG18_big_fil_WC_8_21_14_2_50_31_20]
MLEKQRTIEKEITIQGTGLHTGTNCVMTFKPAPENYGIKFIRVDLGDKPEIPATADYVVDVSRGTTIGIGEARVHTIEHVLAAIVGLQIDNIKIEIDGIEPPVIDGSSLPFVNKLLEAGFVKQDANKDYLIIDETITYKNEDEQVEFVALPSDSYRMTVMVDYQNPALGSQHSGMFDLEKEFITEFAPARTFCFLSEIEPLIEQGLIQGGNIDNAVVIVDHDMSEEKVLEIKAKLGLKADIKIGTTGFFNENSLRFKNEPVRHKLLDMLGDLALIGAPIKAQILAARPGHKANVEFAKKIRKLYQQKKIEKKYQNIKKQGVVFDIEAIQKILPHRYPFLLVDKIIDLEFDKSVRGVKSVTFNELFFQGHFPDRRVMPGVLILEALAQTGGILMLNSLPENEIQNKLVYFMKIDNAKFRKPVVPGDQLILEAEMVGKTGGKYVSMKTKAFVEGQLVCEADMMAAIVDK